MSGEAGEETKEEEEEDEVEEEEEERVIEDEGAMAGVSALLLDAEYGTVTNKRLPAKPGVGPSAVDLYGYSVLHPRYALLALEPRGTYIRCRYTHRQQTELFSAACILKVNQSQPKHYVGMNTYPVPRSRPGV